MLQTCALPDMDRLLDYLKQIMWTVSNKLVWNKEDICSAQS